MTYYLLTFDNSAALSGAAEKLAAYGAVVVSIPAEIDGDCGFAVRLSGIDGGVLSLVSPSEVYRVSGRGRGRTVECLQNLPKC